MNREEMSIELKKYINDYLPNCEFKTDSESLYYYSILGEILEYLQQPISLAEFLGWEEGAEYKVNIRNSYNNQTLKAKIIDNKLFGIHPYTDKWEELSVKLNDNFLNDFRQAEKVEPKLKAYHVKDEYSYNCLMQEWEKQGYTWFSDKKPTHGLNWNMYEADTVIYCLKSKTLRISDLTYFYDSEKDNYDLIEYHQAGGHYEEKNNL